MDELIALAAWACGLCAFFVTLFLIQISRPPDASFRSRAEVVLGQWISNRPRAELVPILRDALRLIQPPRWYAARYEVRQLQQNLRYAGSPGRLTAKDFLALKWASLASSLLATLLLGFLWAGQTLLLVIVLPSGVLGGLVGLDYWLRTTIRRRQKLITRSLPNFIDLLSLSIEAGQGLEPALQEVGRTYQGVLGEEIRILLDQLDHGRSMREVLEDLIERNSSPNLRTFAGAIIQSQKLGTSLAPTLRIQSDLMRTYRRQRAEEAGQQAPIKLAFPLVLFILPALLIIYLSPPLLHLFLEQ
jgi:tight adherence protein C